MQGQQAGKSVLRVRAANLVPQRRRPHLELPAAGVVQHAAVVGDLVEGKQQEAHVHALHNGAEASHRSAHTWGAWRG